MNITKVKMRVKDDADFIAKQEFLFAHGCRWSTQEKPKLLKFGTKYLFVNDSGYITWSDTASAFTNSSWAEVDIRSSSSYEMFEVTPPFMIIDGVKYDKNAALAALQSVPRVE